VASLPLGCIRHRNGIWRPPCAARWVVLGDWVMMTWYAHRRMYLAGAAGGLACVVVALVGCTSSSSKTSASSSKTSASSSSNRAAASPSVSAASAAQLAKIVVQPGDLPTGWEHRPYKADSSDPASTAFARCVGVPNSNSDRVAEAHSDDFTQGDSQISSAALSFQSNSAVDSDIAAMHSSRASPSCLENGIKQQVATDLPIRATVDSVSVKITAGGKANVIAILQGTIKVSLSGEHAMLYLYRAFITGPSIEADVSGYSLSAPFSASVMAPLVAKVANRAAQPSRTSRGAPSINSTTPPTASTSPRQVAIYQLRPGDCVGSPPAPNVSVADLPVVPCSQPHYQEVMATRDLGPGPWPGDAAVKARSTKICTLEFAIYVGIPQSYSRYGLGWYDPAQGAWEEGERSTQCLVADPRGKTTGTLRGARS
jgi:hypothetical protein